MSTDQEEWLQRRRRLLTDDEWQQCAYLAPLLRRVEEGPRADRAAHRFTTACLRRVQGSIFLEGGAQLIAGWERLAAGECGIVEQHALALQLRQFRLACTDVMGGMFWQMSVDYAEEPELDAWRNAWGTAEAVLVARGRLVRLAHHLADDRPDPEHWVAEEQVLCHLLRCIVGNPFRSVPWNPQWFTTNTVELARTIRAEMAFERLPILADALQDAGCTEDTILEHCHHPGPHTRDCWVLELLVPTA